MATFTRVGSLPYQVIDSQKQTITDVALDSSYLSGGETVTPTNLGLTRVEHAEAQPNLSATTSINIAFAGYDPATSLLHVYDNTPAELASADDVDGAVIRVTAWGF